MEQGQISIDTQNILPIIKKWLYSEEDIFVRELVSNAADAITKLTKITMFEGDGIEKDIPDPRIDLEVNKEAGTITISDTGLGLTKEEVKKYINQVAFSGAADFVEKYKDKDATEVIGHFGLGFYSSFMVAENVSIESLSYTNGAKPIFWQSTGDGSFELGEDSKREKVGTTITLHLNEESKHLLDVYKMRGITEKYCGFLKHPVYLQNEHINATDPIWTKNPTELESENYKEFYQKVFPMATEPLFWVHLNVDYPFNLKGVLYFPKLEHAMQAIEGEVKLYCSQVFVEDNCKEIIPEYLTLLRGVIDCPDLPLNVSRSALQADDKVRKIAQHITKKVCDKLSGLCRTDREQYEKYWGDISTFVKYAMLREPEFMTRMEESFLFKASDQKLYTVKEYLDKFQGLTGGEIPYATDTNAQSALISASQEQGIEVAVLEDSIDQHFLPYFEMRAEKLKPKFKRVDAELSKSLVNEEESKEIADAQGQTPSAKLTDFFKQTLGDDTIDIEIKSLKNKELPSVLLLSESERRMAEMMKANPSMMLGASAQQPKRTFIVNKESPAVQKLRDLLDGPNEAKAKLYAQQIYDLARIQNGGGEPELMKSFMSRSIKLLEL